MNARVESQENLHRHRGGRRVWRNVASPRWVAALSLAACVAGAAASAASATSATSAPGATSATAAACKGTLYLTLDTGSMAPAEEIAAILNKHHVQATFFLANEPTARGDTALDPAWAAFWKARVAEGHAFGSHSWRHWYFRQDVGHARVRYVPWGGKAGETLDEAGVCREIRQSEDAFRSLTGRGFDGLWRAPGGKTTPNTLRFAEACGYRHVPWSAAGFSGDELPADRFPADALIATQLRDIRDGDILLWHLGIRSRTPPLYPKLDELLTGLASKGFCFAKITDHPRWKR